MNRKFIVLGVLAGLLTAWPGVAQERSAADGDAVPTVTLTVSPAAEPRPALKYALLPGFPDCTPGNGAPLYDMASELAGRALRTDAWPEGRLTEWSGLSAEALPLDEVRRFLADSVVVAALRHAGYAARRDYCRWEYPLHEPGEAVNLRLLTLPNLRPLARMLALRIRVELLDGDVPAAIDDLQTGFAMARDVATGPTLLHGLVGISIGSLMAEQIEMLMSLPNAPNLYLALADLPTPFPDLRHAMQFERSILQLSFPQLRRAQSGVLSDAEWQQLLDDLGNMSATLHGHANETLEQRWEAQVGLAAMALLSYPQARDHFLAEGQTLVEIETQPIPALLLRYWLSEYMYWRDEVFKWMGLPYWQVHNHLQDTERRLRDVQLTMTPSPVGLLLPSLSRAKFVAARLERQFALLRCIEALRAYAAGHDGRLPAMLADVTEWPIPLDPVTGGSFGYAVDGPTFTLDAPAPAGQPARDGCRYVVTIRR